MTISLGNIAAINIGERQIKEYMQNQPGIIEEFKEQVQKTIDTYLEIGARIGLHFNHRATYSILAHMLLSKEELHKKQCEKLELRRERCLTEEILKKTALKMNLSMGRVPYDGEHATPLEVEEGIFLSEGAFALRLTKDPEFQHESGQYVGKPNLKEIIKQTNEVFGQNRSYFNFYRYLAKHMKH
jgi:hypothetical protein